MEPPSLGAVASAPPRSAHTHHMMQHTLGASSAVTWGWIGWVGPVRVGGRLFVVVVGVMHLGWRSCGSSLGVGLGISRLEIIPMQVGGREK